MNDIFFSLVVVVLDANLSYWEKHFNFLKGRVKSPDPRGNRVKSPDPRGNRVKPPDPRGNRVKSPE